MTLEVDTELAARAAQHRALGDPHRLAIVDALDTGDRTVGELRELVGQDWNLLAFHLRVLEDAGVIARSTSEADRRRRYVRLREGGTNILVRRRDADVGTPLFVCTHNAARSQFAAALWRAKTGQDADSAGTQPAPRVHPLAITVAAAHGIDLSRARPRGYDEVAPADVVISVCDRARETGLPAGVPALHWSVPDPMGAGRGAFERAFADIAARVDRLAAA